MSHTVNACGDLIIKDDDLKDELAVSSQGTIELYTDWEGISNCFYPEVTDLVALRNFLNGIIDEQYDCLHLNRHWEYDSPSLMPPFFSCSDCGYGT